MTRVGSRMAVRMGLSCSCSVVSGSEIVVSLYVRRRNC
jgi:hypothetical protein